MRLAELSLRLYELPIPVIAAVNGVAVGGGLAFALQSDIRIASENARFGSVFIKAGFSSMDMGTSYLLPTIVGAGVARELMLTGRIIDADEAYRITLVHEVVPPDELMTAALAKAREIAEKNAFGVWQNKIGLNAALDAPSLRHAIRDREPHPDPDRFHQQSRRSRQGAHGEAPAGMGSDVARRLWRRPPARGFAAIATADVTISR